MQDNPCQEALIGLLADPSEEQKIDDEERVRRNGQQVSLEGGEAQTLQVERDVRGDWCGRDQEGQADQVDRPHLPVLQTIPEQLEVHSLSVVHRSCVGTVHVSETAEISGEE